jgi:chromosome segregation ATPase
MQIKMIPASQFENQTRVNGLKTRREVNQETIEKLRAKMAKLKREIQDYVAANNEATREITELENQINAAVEKLAAQEQGDQW